MIRFVFLDAAGTLLRPWPSVGELYVRACRPYGLEASPERAQEIFHTIWSRRVEEGDDGLTQAGDDQDAARIWWRQLVNQVLDGLGFAGNRDGCFEACYKQFALPESWHVYAEVRQVVATLRQRRLGVGVLSNWDARLPALLEDLGLAELFDTVVVSALEGCSKPDPAFFLRAARRVGLPAHEILHVGDHPRLDRDAAHQAGFHALLVDRQGGAPGDGTIPDLEGVPDWLASRQGRPGAGKVPDGTKP